jgi:hypothetical protein
LTVQTDSRDHPGRWKDLVRNELRIDRRAGMKELVECKRFRQMMKTCSSGHVLPLCAQKLNHSLPPAGGRISDIQTGGCTYFSLHLDLQNRLAC